MSVVLASNLALAVLLGTAFGTGVALLASRVPRWGAPALDRRIAPYVRDVTDPRGTTVWTAPAARVQTATAIAGRALSGLLGGQDSVARRLAQAGRPVDVASFRASQLAWALAGLLGGGVVIVLAAVLGVPPGPASMIFPLVLAIVGVAARDAQLSAQSRRRTARVSDELPTVLEFLALCLAAGEGIRDSIRRVGDVGSGELTAELRRVSVAVGMGEPLSAALHSLARRVQVPSVSRAVDHLVAAIERGAPLAAVLQAQAADAREEAKQALIERAGRNELMMLFPLVFVILPMSVIFAVFPGILMLRLGFG